MSRPAAAAALLLAAAGCSGERGADASWQSVPLAEERASVMTFNVENLFDAEHDPGKEDWTFLPLAKKGGPEHLARCGALAGEFRREQCLRWDWSEAVVKVKLERIAAAILQGGRGPDIAVLQEVENRAILERLRRGPLAAAGYLAPIHIEGGDPRGIDAAILSRFESAGEPRLHELPSAGKGRAATDAARGILEATLRLPDGELLSVFAVHLPAPSHPRELRERALDELERLRAALPAGRMALAAGDFNITHEEDLLYAPLEKHAGAWLVSHKFGCRDCLGSSFYEPKEQWSFLDMILVGRELHPKGSAPWVVLPGSVRVCNARPEQNHRDGTPARFEPNHLAGVSDHWPVRLELAKRR